MPEEEAKLYEKTNNTLDVWFDSGTTHYTVMRGSHKDDLGFPADSTSKAPISTAAGSTARCSPLR